MKAEINKENKAKLFALYYDQCVLFTTSFVNGESLKTILNELEVERCGKLFYLTLKPLSKISDDDAVECAKLDWTVNWNNGLDPHVWKNTFGITVVSNGTGLIQKYGQVLIGWPYLSPSQVDYLRSRGYALPYLNFTVQNLIDAGWIKIIEE